MKLPRPSRLAAREPFTVPGVLVILIGTLLVPSLVLSIFGLAVLWRQSDAVAPYVLGLVLLSGTIALGITLVAYAAWKGARLSRLKTDFVSHVSHELRTPLTSIRMFIETLQLGRARTDEERQTCLDLLAKETERLSEMIERLLEWSRLEAGRKVFRAQPVRVAGIVDDAVAAFTAQQLELRARVNVDLGASLPEAWADPGAAVDVLVNLLTNAFKYGGPEKDIRLSVRAERGRWVALAVADEGPGIRVRDRKRIFDSFYRADDLLSRTTVGTGLGLTIAQRTAVGLGGSLKYTPREGGGSVFTLRLPVVRPEDRRAGGGVPRREGGGDELRAAQGAEG